MQRCSLAKCEIVWICLVCVPYRTVPGMEERQQQVRAENGAGAEAEAETDWARTARISRSVPVLDSPVSCVLYPVSCILQRTKQHTRWALSSSTAHGTSMSGTTRCYNNAGVPCFLCIQSERAFNCQAGSHPFALPAFALDCDPRLTHELIPYDVLKLPYCTQHNRISPPRRTGLTTHTDAHCGFHVNCILLFPYSCCVQRDGFLYRNRDGYPFAGRIIRTAQHSTAQR